MATYGEGKVDQVTGMAPRTLEVGGRTLHVSPLYFYSRDEADAAADILEDGWKPSWSPMERLVRTVHVQRWETLRKEPRELFVIYTDRDGGFDYELAIRVAVSEWTGVPVAMTYAEYKR